MSICILFIWVVALYNANFRVDNYDFVINYVESIKEFLMETNEVILIVSILFVIVLALQEISHNSVNFDVYFIVRYSRFRFHSAKIIAFIIILCIFTAYLYLGILIIYLWRFNNVYYLGFVFKMFSDTLLYLTFMFLAGHTVVIITNNSFSALIVIMLYWTSRLLINTKLDKYLKYIVLRVKMNYEVLSYGFNVDYFWVIINLSVLIIINFMIYLKKDLKC